jgi:hypothetical protein
MSWERRLFYLLTFLLCLPVWLVTWFPSQDGPSHVYNARVLMDILLHGDSMYWKSYFLTPGLTTNLGAHLLLGVLSQFLPPPVPEKIIVTLCVILVASGVRYATGAMNGRGGALAVLALPAATGLFLHLGSYNFLIGSAFFGYACGFWFRRWGVLTTREVLRLAALLVAMFLCSVTAWLVTALVIGVPALWTAVRRGSALRYLGPTFLAGLPSGALFLAYALSVKPAAEMGRFFPIRSAVDLVTENPIVAYTAGEAWIFAVLVLLAAILVPMVLRAKAAARHWSAYDWLALLAVLLFVLFLAAPLAPMGGTSVRPRLWLFSGLTLLFWLGGHRFSRRDRVFLCTVGAVLSTAVAWSHWKSYRALEPFWKEVMAVRAIIPPGRSVLNLRYSQAVPPPALRIDSLRNAGAYLSPVPGGLWGGNQEAGTGQFPLSSKPGQGAPAGLEGEPPCVDLSTRPLDYIVLSGYPQPQNAAACASSTYRQLADRYDLIYQSTDRFVLVYRLRQTSSPAPAEGSHS